MQDRSDAASAVALRLQQAVSAQDGPTACGRLAPDTVAENWQSEYLQFSLYIFLTVWLLQKGSPESKKLDKAGRESEQEQKIGAYAQEDSPAWARTRGVRLWLFSNSLGLVMGLLFLLSWLAQSIAGTAAFNEEQLGNRQDPVSWAQYLTEPVGSPHTATGVEG